MLHTDLIEAEALHAFIGDAGWLVLDCRHDLANPQAGRAAYAKGHIPGALFAAVDTDLSAAKTGRNGRHPLPSRDDFAATARGWGISAGTQVVAYDASGGMFAARLWWMLRWLGHAGVAVLNGGLQAWTAAGYGVETEAPAARPCGTLQPGAPLVPSIDADALQASLGDGTRRIVDARAPARYRGEVEPLDPVAGHIPGAVNRVYELNLQADGRFKSPSALAEEWRAVMADRPAEAVVHQCGSGITACHNLLAMEVAGLNGSVLYPGSWSEWCADPARPVSRG